MAKGADMTKKLLVRTNPYNGGLVFAREERALLISTIHQAIDSSKTWGEFRAAIPAKEYSKIIVGAFEDGGERRPAKSAPFDPEQLPGWSDGDYPPWLQSEMEAVLPRNLLRQFGRLDTTNLNGSFWYIPEENKAAICAALTSLGVTVEDAEHLRFH